MRSLQFMISHTFFAAVFTVFICGCAKTEIGTTLHSLTEQQIIEIANAKVAREGVTLKERNICYDVGNKKWHSTLASLRKDSPDYVKERDNFSALDGRNYQTVIFTPKKPCFGGILYVFVDINIGEIITIHGEK